MDVVIATGNGHKYKEILRFFHRLSSIHFLSLRDFPSYQPLPEDGESLEEIATTKAQHAAQTLGTWALADDTGLFVPALQGKPGIHTARYAKEGATDQENRQHLLKEMEALTGEERVAYFQCVIAIAHPSGELHTVSGRCEGSILEEEKGGQGFGYDPLFRKEGYDKTFAQLSTEIKNQVSHRAKALEKASIVLERLPIQ